MTVSVKINWMLNELCEDNGRILDGLDKLNIQLKKQIFVMKMQMQHQVTWSQVKYSEFG
jgi:hypothetical protein